MFPSLFFALLFVLSSFPQQAPAPLPATAPSQSFQIAGIVVDALNGQPLSQVQVFIQSQSVANAGQTVSTGDDGRFVFENVVPGHYPLSARRRGYVQQFYKQHESFSTAIIAGPNLDTSHLRFALPPDASISGQVVDEWNDPVRNQPVLLFERGLQSGRRTTWQHLGVATDDQGHYRFGHLLPGTYFVAVSAGQPWYAQHVIRQRIQSTDSSGQIIYQESASGEPELDLVYPITFFSSATDISGAVPITVHPGDAETADLTLRPTPALHVTINYVPSGKPEESENVWPQISQQLIPGFQQQLGTVTSQNRPGVLEIAGLPPGRLNLTLHSAHGAEASAHSLAVQLAADANINISDIAPLAGLSGVVKMDDGSPALRMSLALRNRATGEELVAQVQDTGEFSLPGQSLGSGTYDVFVGGPAAETVGRLSATGAKVSGRSIEVSAGQDVKLTVIVSKGAGRVSGFAVKNGQPLDGVMVVLVPEIPEHSLVLFRRDQSDSDGSFTLPAIVPGKYTVIALENGWDLDWFTPGVLEKYLPGGERVDVSANSKLDVKVNVQP
jgi:protocatechuate 3,4-dioxygenase beta subunit